MRERERERRGAEEEGKGGREKREGQRGKKAWREERKKGGRSMVYLQWDLQVYCQELHKLPFVCLHLIDQY